MKHWYDREDNSWLFQYSGRGYYVRLKMYHWNDGYYSAMSVYGKDGLFLWGWDDLDDDSKRAGYDTIKGMFKNIRNKLDNINKAIKILKKVNLV